jgi:TRAP-type C4-dicarboxylate transport system substrate-binding protein
MGSTINWSAQVKELNLFALPFLFPGYRALDAVQAGEPGKRLFRLIEEKGVVAIGWGENGFRELTNSKRPVRRPEDLQGLRVRVVGIPIFVARTWASLTPEDRTVVRKVGEEITALQKREVREGLEGATTVLDILQKLYGMEGIQLTPDDVQSFRDKTRPVYSKWVEQIGADLVRSAERIVESAK